MRAQATDMVMKIARGIAAPQSQMRVALHLRGQIDMDTAQAFDAHGICCSRKRSEPRRAFRSPQRIYRQGEVRASTRHCAEPERATQSCRASGFGNTRCQHIGVPVNWWMRRARSRLHAITRSAQPSAYWWSGAVTDASAGATTCQRRSCLPCLANEARGQPDGSRGV